MRVLEGFWNVLAVVFLLSGCLLLAALVFGLAIRVAFWAVGA